MFDSCLHPALDQSLADIVREETGDGRLIVRFLIDVMQGGLEDSSPCHRLDAARQLLKLGFAPARQVISALAPQNRMARRTTAPADPSPLHQDLVNLVREETDNGRSAVRFLVDVMLGNLADFKPHHRLFAARELLRLGFHQPAPDAEAAHVAAIDAEEEDIRRRRAEDPDGIYYRGSDFKWYRDELRSPPHPNRARTGASEAEARSASPSSPDGCNPCPEADGPLDFDSFDDDDLSAIGCPFQPADHPNPQEYSVQPAPPSGHCIPANLIENDGEDDGEDDEESPARESPQVLSRERPPPRFGPARISLDPQAALDSLTIIRP